MGLRNGRSLVGGRFRIQSKALKWGIGFETKMNRMLAARTMLLVFLPLNIDLTGISLRRKPGSI